MIDDLDEALRDLLIRELPVTNSEIATHSFVIYNSFD